jgi:metal-responsive CopG/Arc/MetJ family transcriptional regulator
MEAISLKLDKNLLKSMDKTLKEHNYSTRTEFIRDSIRRRLENLTRDELIEEFSKLKGFSSKKTTREENRKTAERVLKEYAKERGWED